MRRPLALLALYNLLLAAVLLAGLPWITASLLFVPRRRTGFAARMGAAPLSPPAWAERTIWLHAVSVGEVRAVSPLLPLLSAPPGPARPLALSTVTVTGQEEARRTAAPGVSVFYFPFDLPFAAGRALARVRPALFVTAETEIWPNFLGACFARGIPVAVVNGRISDRSFARYLRFSRLFRPFFAGVGLWLMQGEEDARRVVELGADPARVRVTGNMKYDREMRAVEVPAAVERWAERGPVLAAGSTHRGEEEALLSLLARPDLSAAGLRMALAPRHPERFAEVAALLSARGVPFLRWTGGGDESAPVLLVDAMGVLDGVYGFSTLAFVGGSLVPVGGHNLLEPASHGIPVLTGPCVDNFRDIARTLIEAGGCRVVADAGELARETIGLLGGREMLEDMGGKARIAARSLGGAAAANARALAGLLR